MTLSFMYDFYDKKETEKFETEIICCHYQIMIITTTIKITHGQFAKIYCSPEKNCFCTFRSTQNYDFFQNTHDEVLVWVLDKSIKV